MVPAYCTNYEYKQLILLWDITTNTQNVRTGMAIITPIWHRAKCYLTSMNNAWYLITVPNMNKITTFISKISQPLNNLWKNCHNYSNGAKLYFTCMRSTWYLILVPNIHQAIMEECTNRWLDRQMDVRLEGQTGPFPTCIFPDSA